MHGKIYSQGWEGVAQTLLARRWNCSPLLFPIKRMCTHLSVHKMKVINMCVMLNATVAMNLVLFNNLGPSRVADPDEVDLDPDPTSKKTRILNLATIKAGSRSNS